MIKTVSMLLLLAVIFSGCANHQQAQPQNVFVPLSISVPFNENDLLPFFKEGNAFLTGEVFISENKLYPRPMVWLIPETPYTKAVIEGWFMNINDSQRSWTNKFPLDETHKKQLFDNSYATFCERGDIFHFSNIPPGHYFLLTRNNFGPVWWYVKKTTLVEHEVVKEVLGELQGFKDVHGIFKPVLLRDPKIVE